MEDERSTLFRLPLSILCIILSKWLTVDSVGVFDTAMSEVTSRQVLLENVFACPEFSFHNNSISRSSLESIINREHGHVFVCWLYLRRIRITKEISLESWISITNESLRMISVHCERLESLNLSGCDEVTDAGIGRLSEGCSMLQTLELI